DEKAHFYAALSDFSPIKRAALFGEFVLCARISIFWPTLSSGGNQQRLTSSMRREPPAPRRERTMESLVDGICNMVGFYLVLGSILGSYIAPFVIAAIRDHHRLPWIGFLNLATGWTVAGWIAALVWSLTAIHHPVAIMGIATAPVTAQPAAA